MDEKELLGQEAMIRWHIDKMFNEIMKTELFSKGLPHAWYQQEKGSSKVQSCTAVGQSEVTCQPLIKTNINPGISSVKKEEYFHSHQYKPRISSEKGSTSRKRPVCVQTIDPSFNIPHGKSGPGIVNSIDSQQTMSQGKSIRQNFNHNPPNDGFSLRNSLAYSDFSNDNNLNMAILKPHNTKKMFDALCQNITLENKKSFLKRYENQPSVEKIENKFTSMGSNTDYYYDNIKTFIEDYWDKHLGVDLKNECCKEQSLGYLEKLPQGVNITTDLSDVKLGNGQSVEGFNNGTKESNDSNNQSLGRLRNELTTTTHKEEALEIAFIDDHSVYDLNQGLCQTVSSDSLPPYSNPVNSRRMHDSPLNPDTLLTGNLSYAGHTRKGVQSLNVSKLLSQKKISPNTTSKPIKTVHKKSNVGSESNHTLIGISQSPAPKDLNAALRVTSDQDCVIDVSSDSDSDCSNVSGYCDTRRSSASVRLPVVQNRHSLRYKDDKNRNSTTRSVPQVSTKNVLDLDKRCSKSSGRDPSAVQKWCNDVSMAMNSIGVNSPDNTSLECHATLPGSADYTLDNVCTKRPELPNVPQKFSSTYTVENSILNESKAGRLNSATFQNSFGKTFLKTSYEGVPSLCNVSSLSDCTLQSSVLPDCFQQDSDTGFRHTVCKFPKAQPEFRSGRYSGSLSTCSYTGNQSSYFENSNSIKSVLSSQKHTSSSGNSANISSGKNMCLSSTYTVPNTDLVQLTAPTRRVGSGNMSSMSGADDRSFVSQGALDPLALSSTINTQKALENVSSSSVRHKSIPFSCRVHDSTQSNNSDSFLPSNSRRVVPRRSCKQSVPLSGETKLPSDSEKSVQRRCTRSQRSSCKDASFVDTESCPGNKQRRRVNSYKNNQDCAFQDTSDSGSDCSDASGYCLSNRPSSIKTQSVIPLRKSKRLEKLDVTRKPEISPSGAGHVILNISSDSEENCDFIPPRDFSSTMNQRQNHCGINSDSHKALNKTFVINRNNVSVNSTDLFTCPKNVLLSDQDVSNSANNSSIGYQNVLSKNRDRFNEVKNIPSSSNNVSSVINSISGSVDKNADNIHDTSSCVNNSSRLTSNVSNFVSNASKCMNTRPNVATDKSYSDINVPLSNHIELTLSLKNSSCDKQKDSDIVQSNVNATDHNLHVLNQKADIKGCEELKDGQNVSRNAPHNIHHSSHPSTRCDKVNHVSRQVLNHMDNSSLGSSPAVNNASMRVDGSLSADSCSVINISDDTSDEASDTDCSNASGYCNTRRSLLNTESTNGKQHRPRAHHRKKDNARSSKESKQFSSGGKEISKMNKRKKNSNIENKTAGTIDYYTRNIGNSSVVGNKKNTRPSVKSHLRNTDKQVGRRQPLKRKNSGDLDLNVFRIDHMSRVKRMKSGVDSPAVLSRQTIDEGLFGDGKEDPLKQLSNMEETVSGLNLRDLDRLIPSPHLFSLHTQNNSHSLTLSSLRQPPHNTLSLQPNNTGTLFGPPRHVGGVWKSIITEK